MGKPTYAEIAATAGVGSATVERVLNGRGGVSHRTTEKVILAARKLDWPGQLPERHRGITRLEVILVRPETSFYARLARAFRRVAASLDPAIQLHVTFLEEGDPRKIAERISNPTTPRSGLVISTPDHSAVHDALMRAIGANLPIVQVVNRTVNGADFVGIDNIAVGRTAGLMMARLGAVEGTVVAMCHSQVYQVHRDRIRGFSEYLRENPRAGLRFAHVYFGMDSKDSGAELVKHALETWGDLAGFYNAGGGNSGVLAALRSVRRHVFFVGHELNDITASALSDGTADVIFDQLPEAQARRAIDILLSRIGLIGDRIENPPIRFTTITAENI